jgi:hypothetical protein
VCGRRPAGSQAHTDVVDVLVSGADREPRPLPQPPSWLVGLAALLVAAAGVLAAAELQRLPVRVTDGAMTVTVRGQAREALLELQVETTALRPVRLRSVEVDVPGVRLQRARLPKRLVRGRAAPLRLSLIVEDCDRLGTAGVLRLRSDDRTATLPAPPSLATGCRAPSSPGDVALAVRTVGGSVRPAPGRTEGRVLLEVQNLGAPVALVAASAEVPGVVFVAQPQPGGRWPLATGEIVRVPLDFLAPFCRAVDRGGRVLVTVEAADGRLRQVGYRVSGLREARAPRDVHLDPLFDTC